MLAARRTYIRELLGVLLEQAEPDRGRGCLTAGGSVELAEDRGDMVVDGLPGDDESVGDLCVAQALGEQREDL